MAKKKEDRAPILTPKKAKPVSRNINLDELRSDVASFLEDEEGQNTFYDVHVLSIIEDTLTLLKEQQEEIEALKDKVRDLQEADVSGVYTNSEGCITSIMLNSNKVLG